MPEWDAFDRVILTAAAIGTLAAVAVAVVALVFATRSAQQANRTALSVYEFQRDQTEREKRVTTRDFLLREWWPGLFDKKRQTKAWRAAVELQMLEFEISGDHGMWALFDFTSRFLDAAEALSDEDRQAARDTLHRLLRHLILQWHEDPAPLLEMVVAERQREGGLAMEFFDHGL